MVMTDDVSRIFLSFCDRVRRLNYSRLTMKFQSSIILIAAVSLVVALFAIYKEVAKNANVQATLATATLEKSSIATEVALRDALASKANSIGRFIADASKDYILSYDLVALRKMQKDAESDGEVLYAYFTKKNGKLYLKRDSDYPQSSLEERFPINVGKELIAYFVIGMNTENILRETEQNRTALNQLKDDVSAAAEYAQWSIVKIIVTATVLLLVATLFMVYYFFRSMILSPVNELREAALAVQHGDLQTQAINRSNDEIGQLAITFNNMIDALRLTTVSKEYLESIIRSMGDMLIVLDGSGKIVMANPALLSHTGYHEHELLGEKIDILFTDDVSLRHVFSELTSASNIKCYETCFRAKSGELLHVELSGNYLTSSSTVFGIVMAATDIRERLMAKEQLEEKNRKLENINKQLDQFAYIVSHDLKAPLRAIANLSSWIEEDLGATETENVREQMNLLRGRVNRLESLINGILEYSRAGRIVASEERVSVDAMLREIIEGMPVPVKYTITVGKGMPEFYTAKVPLSQVFSNLISNAIKYRKSDSGNLSVAVEELRDRYMFFVKDDGPGIAPEYHKKIFEIFQTLLPRDQFESTGVGLSIVKKIVEDLGGIVRIESEPGQGATFIFTWPKQYQETKAA